jgi:uncharacterized protein (TIGR02452 family)
MDGEEQGEHPGGGRENRSDAKRRRADVAAETAAIVRSGRYRCLADPASGGAALEVDISEAVRRAQRATALYDWRALPTPLPDRPPRFDEPCSLVVTNESAVAAIRRECCRREEAGDAPRATVGCLNFASAKNPGGGWLKGAQAQEECLARASALVACLETQLRGYYTPNRSCRSPLYLDIAIVSPSVPFFRDEREELLEQPLACTVITVPAPNRGALMANNNRGGSGPREPDEALSESVDRALDRRAEMILSLASDHGVDTLILGAWGCGVFRNDPDRVARLFASKLRDRYRNQFRRVVFAVLDSAPRAPTFESFARAVREIER